MKPELKELPPVDMSQEAIDERFRMVESLRKLCVSLKEAGEQAAAMKNGPVRLISEPDGPENSSQ